MDAKQQQIEESEQAESSAHAVDPSTAEASMAARPSIWQLPCRLFWQLKPHHCRLAGEPGAQSLAALAQDSYFLAMQAILMAISAGTTALVARAWGAGMMNSRVTMASLVLAAVVVRDRVLWFLFS